MEEQAFHIIEVSRSHSHTKHSVGLLWTSDQPVSETSTWQHNTHSRQTDMPQPGFHPAMAGSELPQTQALDHAATRIGVFGINQDK